VKLNTRVQRIAAAVTITVVTIVIIGIALFATTPLGCGPAKAMHMKISSYRCATVASISPSPSPLFPGFASPGATTSPPYPYTEPASSNPYPQPGSGNPYPQPGSGNPYFDSASGFPPFGSPASGQGIPPELAMNCRLPIYAGGPGSGGFIVLPNGNFIADPRSAVTAPSPSPGAPTPPPGYGGYQGWWGTTYDRAYSKWLPVPYRWVSPDGTRYAYPGRPDGIYIQNVANGTQVEVGEGSSWQVLDVDATAVYAITGSTGGLWRLPFSGTVTQITSTGYWQAVGSGFAYGTPTSQVPQGATTTIIRLDLKNGSTADYFASQVGQSAVQGFDGAGNPIIYVQGQNVFDVVTVTAPYTATRTANLYGTNFYPNGPPIPDRHGLWLASGNGIALYVQGVGWYKMSGFGGSLAGGCY
jgi:hypothetical protein